MTSGRLIDLAFAGHAAGFAAHRIAEGTAAEGVARMTLRNMTADEVAADVQIILRNLRGIGMPDNASERIQIGREYHAAIGRIAVQSAIDLHRIADALEALAGRCWCCAIRRPPSRMSCSNETHRCHAQGRRRMRGRNISRHL
jgi:hypothetical protein